ncbi:MAG TPA: serine/threonine-protein kinase [Gemmataceae bacterium]|nr:serine/threonine-protein kinase [Gemmataceae bacterium]
MRPKGQHRLGDSSRPFTSEADELPDDPRLLQAVQEYLDQLEKGRHPSRADFLHRYSVIAEPLARCLDGLELVHKAASKEKSLSSHAGRFAPAAEILTANPLGDFQIMHEIGRGGMGIVYEAVQLSLGRRVALKVLPFAATFDAKHLQRFHNEAQAAAHLHHTNIVPVYWVGAERGVHFYAMQLIDGQSLAVVIRQMRQQAGHAIDEEDSSRHVSPPRAYTPDMATVSYPPTVAPVEEAVGTETVSPLSLALTTQRSSRNEEFFRTAARLVVQAAEALEHAHQFGIVHRDIKPANLLVDVHGRLWITDFGLAQFHAEAGLTQTGDILGTLRYMSPEQASGQRVLIDHRTDVYSLGATLYELATLEPIYPGQNRQELLHQIIHTEPRAPRAVEKTVPVELETIILKAVSKNPAERYGSAHELAEDLGRYLDNKPIQAKRPSLLERARKWSRRHPELVAAGVILLLVCIGLLLVNNRMIAEEKTHTAAALEREHQRAVEAEQQFQQALQAVNLLVQVCEEELADAPPHLQGVRQRLLEIALRYYQDFIEQQRGNAGAQAALAEGQNRVRRILDELSTLQGAHQLVLVTAPDVQKDLELSDEQCTRIARLGERWSREGPAHYWDQKKFLTLARENETALATILDEGQLRRLGQIALQTRGTLPFHESRVIDGLHLTAEQKRKIREIEGSMFAGMRPGPHSKGSGDYRKPKGDPFRKAVEEILKVLSTEQQAKWRELTGEPFMGRAFCPPPPPHSPGPFGPR